MRHIATAIIGGGQAGLALSRCLTARGVDHVVFERGRLAERWRSERWDSLRLLTPNWLTRLPEFAYSGPDRNGFMAMPELVRFFEQYAATFSPPLETNTTVRSVGLARQGFHVVTNRGRWLARTVVVATGYSDVPAVPAMARNLAADITQVVPTAYRRPSQLPDGGVLVVGASATGIQLAQELHLAGRRVVLATGHHTRVPRTYRGRDLFWWLDRMGVLSASAEDVYDVEVSRDQASFQLVGRPDYASIDLASLRAQGVTITGRLAGIFGSFAGFHDDLVGTTAAADVKLASLLRKIDRFIDAHGLDEDVPEPPPFVPLSPTFMNAPITTLDLRKAGITTVLWATGYRRNYSWLRLPGLFDRRGEIVHRKGVTLSEGLYVLGLQFQCRRNSSFIDGVGHDAVAIAEHLSQYLGQRPQAVAKAS